MISMVRSGVRCSSLHSFLLCKRRKGIFISIQKSHYFIKIIQIIIINITAEYFAVIEKITSSKGSSTGIWKAGASG
jgi:hypothetical protein